MPQRLMLHNQNAIEVSVLMSDYITSHIQWGRDYLSIYYPRFIGVDKRVSRYFIQENATRERLITQYVIMIANRHMI